MISKIHQIDQKQAGSSNNSIALQNSSCKMLKKMRYHLKKYRLLSHLWSRMLSCLILRRWIILIASEVNNGQPTWHNFAPVFPPSDRSWADPFVWYYKGEYYIFVEELPYATNRGRIACLYLDEQMRVRSHHIVLERPYHLSYPFLFQHENHLYMLPETKGNCTIELYRCVSFPNDWVPAKTLISDILAVDSTLIKVNNKWWLFTYVSDLKNNGSDSLRLYYADNPLSSSWTPHPQNPIKKDIKCLRPAGRIFLRNGELIRPAQDCSIRYGYAINFNRITRLTELEYEEVYESTIKPPPKTNIRATHTWNENKGLYATDALLYEWKLDIGKGSASRQR